MIVIGAEWCSACKSLKQVLENNNIGYTYIDADKNPEVIKEFNIRSLPTTIIKSESDTVVIIGNKVDQIIKALKGQ